QAERLATNLSTLLAEHFENVFGRVREQLDRLAGEVADAENATVALDALGRVSIHAPAIAGMAVVDGSGDVLHSIGRMGAPPTGEAGTPEAAAGIGVPSSDGL